MTRTLLALGSVLFGLLGHTAIAQPVPPSGPIQRPTISPYLNLLNRGGSPALNYLGIVRPQQQLAQQFGQLQQQANLTNQFVNQALSQEVNLVNELLAPTGNVATFNNTGNYFNRFGSSFAAGGGAASGTSRPTGAGSILQRPSFAGGGGIGGGSRPSTGGGLRR